MTIASSCYCERSTFKSFPTIFLQICHSKMSRQQGFKIGNSCKRQIHKYEMTCRGNIYIDQFSTKSEPYNKT